MTCSPQEDQNMNALWKRLGGAASRRTGCVSCRVRASHPAAYAAGSPRISNATSRVANGVELSASYGLLKRLYDYHAALKRAAYRDELAIVRRGFFLRLVVVELNRIGRFTTLNYPAGNGAATCLFYREL